MIILELVCDKQHQFEGWFPSQSGFELQLEQGIVCCPVCDSETVSIISSANQTEVSSALQLDVKLAGESERDSEIAADIARKIQDYMKQNFDYDGDDEFVAEIRQIHPGDAEELYLEDATGLEDVTDFKDDETIDTFSSTPAKDKSKLN